jgi:hypothetical protein
LAQPQGKGFHCFPRKIGTTFRDNPNSRQIALIGLPWTTDLRNRLHDQHSNPARHDQGSQCGSSSRGVPIDDDPERKLFVPAADLVEMTLDLGMKGRAPL